MTLVQNNPTVASVAPAPTARFGRVMIAMLPSLVGFAIERLAYKPLRKAPRLNVLITAIGVSLLLHQAACAFRAQARLRLRASPGCCRLRTVRGWWRCAVRRCGRWVVVAG